MGYYSDADAYYEGTTAREVFASLERAESRIARDRARADRALREIGMTGRPEAVAVYPLSSAATGPRGDETRSFLHAGAGGSAVRPGPSSEPEDAPHGAFAEAPRYPTPPAATSVESAGGGGTAVLSCREDATAGRDRHFDVPERVA